jgi:dynein heavy chain 2
LFFVLTDMRKLNNMYEFSLNSFLRIFEQALGKDDDSSKEDTEVRIKMLKSRLEKLTFKWISRSLFKDDRTMFSLHLIRYLKPSLFLENEWELFTGQILETESIKESTIPSWIPQDRLKFMRLLIVLHFY